MRIGMLMMAGAGAMALTVVSAAAAPAAAQGGSACVSPMPVPLAPGMGGRGFGGRGGPPPGAAPADSTMARRGRGARRRGCPPFFPDSLALTPEQTQQIVALRAGFRQSNAAAFAQLRAIGDSARAARAAGATRDQIRAIDAQARPIEQALRPANDQVQAQVEALLTPGQLAWMNAFRAQRGRRPRRARR